MWLIFIFPALTQGFFVWFWGGLWVPVRRKGDNNVVIIFKEAPSPGPYHQTQRKANRHWRSVANLSSWSGNLVWARDHMFVWCHRPLQLDLKTHTDLVRGSAVENIKQAYSQYIPRHEGLYHGTKTRLLRRWLLVIFGRFHQVFFLSARLQTWQTSRPPDRLWLTAAVP